jgi:hypothetical protein
MSRWYGDIFQNGFVVHDWAEATRHWVDVLGVGPFFLLDHIEFDWCEYRGRPVQLDLSVTLGFSGDCQIELIQQHNDVESVYTEFLRDHGTGLQHVGTLVDNLDAALDLHGLREKVVQQGAIPGCRFAYVDTALHGGGMLELIEAGPDVRQGFEDMRQAAVNWDGNDPLRG